MERLAIVLAVLALAAGVANATRPVEETAIGRNDVTMTRATILWFDDMESGDNGWTHGDFTASDAPRFHVDSYMAFGAAGHSWWCGSFDYDADGGYGNNWYEYLDIPTTDVSSAGAGAVLTFAFRYDSEPTDDFTCIQAESLGVWTDLDAFDGYGAWYDIGPYGYLIDAYDNPFKGRFLFTSDGMWSDADGDNTVGGGFACDNIKLFDLYSGAVLFYDDAESGGLCIPGHLGASGDYWHRRYDDCSSYSPHYSWWCGDDADTSLIPPFLNNWLQSPWVAVQPGWANGPACRIRQLMHFEIPTRDDDRISIYCTFDGIDYYLLKAYWGDFGTCGCWLATAYNGFDVTALAAGWPEGRVAVMYLMSTSANGCGPGEAGGAGVTIDNVWFEAEYFAPAEEKSWGSIKAMYR